MKYYNYWILTDHLQKDKGHINLCYSVVVLLHCFDVILTDLSVSQCTVHLSTYFIME